LLLSFDEDKSRNTHPYHAEKENNEENDGTEKGALKRSLQNL